MDKIRYKVAVFALGGKYNQIHYFTDREKAVQKRNTLLACLPYFYDITLTTEKYRV